MQQDFSLKAYHYTLPPENIAQHPADARENSRLLVLNKTQQELVHNKFYQIIDLINPGDLLVLNNTKVFPARLLGKKETGGKVEVFLLSYPMEHEAAGDMQHASATALIKSSKRPKPGSRLSLGPDLSASVIELLDDGKVKIDLHYTKGLNLTDILNTYGQVPLPPYISRTEGTNEEDRKRYQTVYASSPGAVAAPTAGLHFTRELLDKIRGKGVGTTEITLHVGHGTFAPVRCEEIRNHDIHAEYVSVSQTSADTINAVRKRGGKIWAVGTTTVRTLEYMAGDNGEIRAGSDWCKLYIVPGFEFTVVDNLITNFHLPESSLLFLVSALCGRETLLKAYAEAIQTGYRFYSYGDAMAVIS